MRKKWIVSGHWPTLDRSLIFCLPGVVCCLFWCGVTTQCQPQLVAKWTQKASLRSGPEWHWERVHTTSHRTARPLTSLQSHCWSCFQNLAKWLNVNHGEWYSLSPITFYRHNLMMRNNIPIILNWKIRNDYCDIRCVHTIDSLLWCDLILF